MSFVYKSGYTDGYENKTYDPYREEDLGPAGTHDGARLVKKTYDITYSLAYERGKRQREMEESLRNLKIETPIYFQPKKTCPHCGKEL